MDRNRAGVTFLDNETLIVHEVALDTGKLSSRQHPDVSSPFQLRVSAFDASSGKLMSTKEWGTRAHESSIQVTTGGLLVRTGEILRVSSRDFKEIQQVSLSPPDPGGTWVISVSTSGKTILVNQYNRNLSHFVILDGSTFKVKQMWNETPPLRRLYSISDAGIAAADTNQQHIIVSEFGSRVWKRVGEKARLRCVGIPTLVADDRMVNACKEFSLLSTNGELIWNEGFEKKEGLEWGVAVAQNGRVVAASLNRSRGSDFWDTGKGIATTAREIVVYDLSQKKRILTTEVVPLPELDYDYALSPDGSKLAILNDRKVSVYSVPIQ